MDARWCAGCWTILSNGTVIAKNHRIGRCCATSRAAREEPSVPFGAKEPHGKRNYVAVFAFETSAFAGACS